MTDTRSAAWDTYAHTKPQRRSTNARGESTWFNWTQYADHGPGAELLALRPGDRVLDLGCGSAGNLAHLATLGMAAVGVDLSARQLAKAHDRWPHMTGTELHQADALTYLDAARTAFDAIYSVFGAAWFTDPELLLPRVYAALKPGGTFALSQRPPVEGCYGCQASYIPRGPDEDPAVVKRWDHTPETWHALLTRHGFPDSTATLLPAPAHERRTTPTLLLHATRNDQPHGLPAGPDPCP